MPLRDFNPKLSDEAREAISAAFDAIAECHNEVAASSEKVVTKIAQAARALGWPDQVVSCWDGRPWVSSPSGGADLASIFRNAGSRRDSSQSEDDLVGR